MLRHLAPTVRTSCLHANRCLAAGRAFGSAPYPEEWSKRALKELGGKPIESLEVTTPEGLRIKPVYTKNDVNPESISQEPGVYPFTRGCVRGGTPRVRTTCAFESRLSTPFAATDCAFVSVESSRAPCATWCVGAHLH
jgi:hypothetical protein